jgi:hypothetical protein
MRRMPAATKTYSVDDHFSAGHDDRYLRRYIQQLAESHGVAADSMTLKQENILG